MENNCYGAGLKAVIILLMYSLELSFFVPVERVAGS